MKYAIISTEKGDMKAELYANETPITVDNFVKLAESHFSREAQATQSLARHAPSVSITIEAYSRWLTAALTLEARSSLSATTV